MWERKRVGARLNFLAGSLEVVSLVRGDCYSPVYTRVLTRVQLTSCPEQSSNPPMDVG